MSHNKDWVGLMVTNCTIILSIRIKASQHWVKNQFALRDSALLLSPTFSPFPRSSKRGACLNSALRNLTMMGSGLGFQRALGTQQETQGLGQLY